MSVVLLLTLFKVSGTSIHRYYEMFQDNAGKQAELIAGTPKYIRSDEWSLIASLTLSQSLVGYPPVNPFVANGESVSVIYDAPNTHWSTLFKPANSSFFVAPDVEYGFAFKWWFRGVILIFAAYLILKKLTGNFWLSAAGGILFFLSPFMQWWYSTPAVDMTGYLLLCAYFAINLLVSKNIKSMVLNALGIVYFAIAAVVWLYPPFTITVGIGATFLVLAYAIAHRETVRKNLFKEKVLVLIATALLTTLILFIYYLDQRDIINTIVNTAYPGNRTLDGGGMNIQVLLSGFLNFRLQDIKPEVPAVWSNQSEASGFLLVGLFLIPIVIAQNINRIRRKLNVDYISLFLAGYLILALVWVFFGLPDVLAKVTLLNRVPVGRMLLGIGVFSYILMLYYLSKIKHIKLADLKKHIGIIVVAVVSIGLQIYLIQMFRLSNLGYIPGKAFVLVAVVICVAVFSLMLGYKRIFMVTMIAFSIFCVYRVNPIYRGLNVSKDIAVIQAIKTIDQEDKGSHKWAVFNDATFGNLLVANGIHTINGTHIYPQLSLWKTLDPTGKFDFYYNRYAHIGFVPAESGFKFRDIPSVDAVVLDIDPCNEFFPANNVKYIVSFTELNKSCLLSLKTVISPVRKIFVYQLK
jgi:hypothetical protein